MAVARIQKQPASDAEGHHMLARAESHSDRSGELSTVSSSCQYMLPPFDAKSGKDYKPDPEKNMVLLSSHSPDLRAHSL